MKAIVLFSGGLDSTTCLALAVEKYGRENVTALSVSYGQKHKKEIEAADKVASFYGVNIIRIDFSEIFKSSNCSLLDWSNDEIPEKSYVEQLIERNGSPVSTYVPFRNGLFLAAAASLAVSLGCEVVYYGAHKDDAAGNAYPDCGAEFNEYISKAIYTGSGQQVKVVAPFIDKTKADIVRVGLGLNVPYEMTWSCYEGGDRPCGKCGTCIDRIEAFRKNGREDPIYGVYKNRE